MANDFHNTKSFTYTGLNRKRKEQGKKSLEKVAVGRGGGSGPLWQNHESERIFKTMIKRIQNHPFQIIKYPLLRGQPVNQIIDRRIYSIKRSLSWTNIKLEFSLHVWYNWKTGWKLKVHGRTWLGGSPLWKVVQDVKSYLLYTTQWAFQGR